MKKILLLIITVVVHGNAFSQYSHNITPDGPSHVLKPGYSRYTADTVYNVVHVPNPYEPTASLFDGTPRVTGYTIYKRSEDGLTDTIYINSGLASIDIRHYNENQRIVYSIFDYPPCKIYECNYVDPGSLYEKVEYEYDTEDRVSKVTVKEIESILDMEVRTVSVNTYDYSTLKMTEKGYVYNGYEYELDSNNRVTYLKNLSTPDEYRELDGKKYRVQDSYYTYFEGGLSVLRREKTSDMIRGWADRWVKVDYYFNENGNGTFKNTYYSVDDGETWTIWEKTETRYAYVENVKSGDIPNTNGSVESSGTKVHGISGAIVINTENNVQACIYDTTGKVVKKQSVNAGAVQISVPGGLYFVTVNNHSYKVIVK
ncbi:MAG: T9SS type A sorting domain-containing protein [Tannerella sp.]|jgi:hypothetical protein|nr:T9SS type A sorting domain-containing protein [Tannerella sp.]